MATTPPHVQHQQRLVSAVLADDANSPETFSSPCRVMAALDGSSFISNPTDTSAFLQSRQTPHQDSSMTMSETHASRHTPSLLERSEHFEQQRRTRREALAEQVAAREQINLTFSPRINRPATHIDPRAATERLHRDAQERSARKAVSAMDAHDESFTVDATMKGPRRSERRAKAHVDEMLRWDGERRRKHGDAAAAHERDEIATLRKTPSIDPVSRVLAQSASRSKRSSRTNSPVVQATPPPATAEVPKARVGELVDRLYYRDAEVRKLEQQLAVARAAKDDRRSRTPKVCRRSSALMGDALPTAQPVHERLLHEGRRDEEKKAAARAAAEAERQTFAQVSNYIGPVSRVLGEVAKSRQGSTPIHKTRQPVEPEGGTFAPKINPKSAAIDRRRHATEGPRSSLLLQRGKEMSSAKAQLRKDKENAEAATVKALEAEGKRLATSRSNTAQQQRNVLSFSARQSEWLANRDAARQRLKQQAHEAEESARVSSCTFTPRTNPNTNAKRKAMDDSSCQPVVVNLFDSP